MTARAELVVRATALYLPILITLALAAQLRPDRRRIAGALLATAWNVPALLAVNIVAERAGWWSFHAPAATVAGIPADLWLGWALLWGAVPLLATTRRFVLVGVILVALDLALMPLAGPVVVLDRTWLIGEGLAVATCLVPGLLLGRWTARDEHVNARAALQVVAFTGLLLFVLPSLIFVVTGAGWAPLLDRPRWHFLLAAVVLTPAGAMAVQAVREFAAHGGTPVPLDPPKSLVTTGPYAYVANPMQLGGTLVLAGWGVLLASPPVLAAAAMSAIFSAGLAAWTESSELNTRYGRRWSAYRSTVRLWLPHWRPAVEAPAEVFVALNCDPCSDVGTFLTRRNPIGLKVRSAEEYEGALQRITYAAGGSTTSGLAAIGRSLEHVNLAWACLSWIARLPGIAQALQLITDAVGGGPRPSRATAAYDECS